MVSTLADMEGNETFDASSLGTADEVVEERVADDAMILIKGCRFSKAITLLLRGANDYMLDEMDRSIHDSLCVVKRVLESGSVVPGGGAVEAALSIYLENFATTLGSREQLAIGEFATALLVLPKTLAVNAAKDATELVSASGRAGGPATAPRCGAEPVRASPCAGDTATRRACCVCARRMAGGNNACAGCFVCEASAGIFAQAGTRMHMHAGACRQH